MSRKYWFKALVLFAVSASIAYSAIHLYRPDIADTIGKILQGVAGNGTNASRPGTPGVPGATGTPIAPLNNTTGANEGGGGAGGASGGGGTASNTSKTVPVRLEISNICSATQLFEGIVLCALEKGPYYMLLQNDSSTVNTSFYNASGFTQTLNSSGGNVLLFNVYIEDLATLDSPIQNMTVDGNATAYLSIRTYTTTGGAQAARIAIVPVYANSSALSPGDWNDLDMRVNTLQKTYSVGTLWFRVA